MKSNKLCPVCNTALRVTHTYDAGNNARTSSLKCYGCKKIFTVLSIIVGNSEEVGGAYTVANEIRNGKSIKELI